MPPEPSARPLDLICCGRAAADLYAEQLGARLEDVASFSKYIGGCAANIAVGTARQGLKSSMLTRVGDDHMGRFVRETLQREGVDTGHVSTDPQRLTGLVLGGGGNADRGREVFQDVERSLCLKCHRLGAEGGRIGPDLTGIGRRFSRVHILESILQPSRTIAPSYESVAVALNSGQVLTGIRVAETAAMLTLGDNQAKLHDVPRSEIDETRVQSLSTMPEGLETKLTEQQFVDLIAFLAAQRE